MKKVFVDVIAECKNGQIIPLQIIWPDGRCFEVDKVLEVKVAAAHNVGGTGTRYKVKINGQEKYIWNELDRWFVEAR